ncbi:MAG: SDR family oxidoreductase [Microbacterium sp.]
MTTDPATWEFPITDPLATADGPRLPGRVAVVAGGGLSGPEGGVGFGMAWLYHRNGAAVAVLDRDEAAASRTVAGIRAAGGEAEGFVVDITDDADVARTVDAVVARFGRIDVVADSVGGAGIEGIFETSVEAWDFAMELNLKSAWYLLRHAQRHMSAGAAAVLISSGAAEGRGPGLPYSIAKAALEKFTTGAAATLAPRGIRVNCVRVGMIWGAFAAKGMGQEQREIRRRNVAMQVEGNSWDIASAALFLSTDASRWVSGQILSVDGGGIAARNVGQAGA